MGIIDTIKGFFQTREHTKEADQAIAGMKAAAKSENYNQASIKAFYALETIGSVYGEQERNEFQTAREYAKALSENGVVTENELEPIILRFELAKYSPHDVSQDDYSEVEQSLETVAGKFKSGRSPDVKKKRRSRRRPRRGGRTGAARKRSRKDE